MATRIYQIGNGPMATAAAPVKVTTGTVIKTMLQLSTPATLAAEISEWGISFDGFAAALPGACELVDTVAINATVTAAVANDITKVSQAAAGMASQMTLGTANTGYTGSAEGTVTAARQFDTQLLPPTAPYVKQWPLEMGPEMLLSEFLRIRCTFGTAVSVLCYIVWKE